MPAKYYECVACGHRFVLLTLEKCPSCSEDIPESSRPHPEDVDTFFYGPKVEEETLVQLLKRRPRLSRFVTRSSFGARPVKPDPVSGEVNENLMAWALTPGVIASMGSVFFLPFLQELQFPVSLLAALAIQYSYSLVILFGIVLGFGRIGGVSHLVVEWLSWAWFIYWVWYQNILLPAYVGLFLVILTFGRVAWMYEYVRSNRV